MFLNNVTRQMSSIQQASEQNECGVGDIVINVSSGNSFFLGDRTFELPELKLLIDAVSSAFGSIATIGKMK